MDSIVESPSNLSKLIRIFLSGTLIKTSDSYQYVEELIEYCFLISCMVSLNVNCLELWALISYHRMCKCQNR